MAVTRRNSKNPDPSRYNDPDIKLDSGDQSDPLRGQGEADPLRLDAIMGGRLNFPNFADDVWDNYAALVRMHGMDAATAELRKIYKPRPLYIKGKPVEY